jgi:hypothetical protein
MEVYYKLVGIDEKVIAGKGMIEPQGVLPRYTESLIGYFQELEKQIPADKEITILEYSGVDTIKIRYKYTDSVIKKLVKLGLRNSKFLEEPLKIFLKGGALHDLIGMLFVCSYPYEKEWVARTLYNFFEYDNLGKMTPSLWILMLSLHCLTLRIKISMYFENSRTI